MRSGFAILSTIGRVRVGQQAGLEMKRFSFA
jgi:hypothetical protein